MKTWHPWRWLRDHYPDVVVRHLPLAVDRMGEVSGAEIRLNERLSQAERRATLTHELIHIERRGREHPNRDVEEAIVERETARRLITHRQLVDAFAWYRHPGLAELADHWWVDQQTALVRMEHLDPVEVAAIEHACDGDWSWTAPDVEQSARYGIS